MPLIAAKTSDEISVVNLPNNFLSLTRKTKDVYQLEVKFLFDLTKVKLTHAFKVRIQALEKRRGSIDSNTNSLINNDSILDSQTALTRLQQGQLNLETKIFFSTFADLTTSINNSHSSVDGKKTEIKIKSYNDNLIPESVRIEAEPETQQTYVNKQFFSFDYANYIVNGKDPVEQLSKTFNDQILFDKLSSTKLKPQKNDPLANRISSYFKRDNPSKKLSQVISIQKSDWMTTGKKIPVSLQDLRLGRWYFYFDVLDKNNNVIQIIERSYNLNDLVGLAETSMELPQIRGAITNVKGTNFSSFICYGSSDKLSNLNLSVSDTSVSTNKLKNLSYNQPLIGSHVSGRTFYSNDSNNGNNFSSFTVVDRRHRTNNGCVIATQRSPGNFDLLAANLHPRTISVIFYFKDLTNRNKNWQRLSGQQKVNENNEVIFTFSGGETNHIYEFFAETYMNDGTQIDSMSDIVEAYSIPNFNLNVKVENFLFQNNDATFDLNFEIQDKATDSIISLLQSRGLQDYFTDKTQDQISQIKNFIGFSIFRFNITSGRRDYLGAILAGSFSDKNQSDLMSVEPINSDNDYQYEIFPTIIDPNSMYENQVEKKYSNDLTSNYLSNNFKFKQLVTQKHSTIFTANGLKNKFSSTLLDNNVIGYSTVQVVKKMTNATIDNFRVKDTFIMSDYYHTVLEWECENNGSEKVDFFVINRCCNGRELDNVGKISYSQKINGVFNFIDTNDVYGNITYQIMPIYVNGFVGTVFTTNIFINGGE